MNIFLCLTCQIPLHTCPCTTVVVKYDLKHTGCGINFIIVRPMKYLKTESENWLAVGRTHETNRTNAHCKGIVYPWLEKDNRNASNWEGLTTDPISLAAPASPSNELLTLYISVTHHGGRTASRSFNELILWSAQVPTGVGRHGHFFSIFSYMRLGIFFQNCRDAFLWLDIVQFSMWEWQKELVSKSKDLSCSHVI